MTLSASLSRCTLQIALASIRESGPVLALLARACVELTSSGAFLSSEWENLFVGEEPVLETVTGLTDGSITGLVVILSSHLTNLDASHTIFATLLTLASVALTNFSSFFLGGKTERARTFKRV